MAYRKIEQYDHDTTEQIASHIKAILGLQVQERLTEQIRDCIQESLQPLGVAVVIEVMHTCMSMRGVQKSNAITTTSAFSGIFLNSQKTRNEFLKLIEK